MQSRIINPEITSLKDEILKIITKLLLSNPSELYIIIQFITFLEGVYLGTTTGIHMPTTELEFETIYFEFKRVLTFLKSPPPDTKLKLINFSKEIKFAACINHHIRILIDFTNNLLESENYIYNHDENVNTNLALAIRFYIENQCRICRLNKHGRMNIPQCEDMLLQNMHEYLMRYPTFNEMEPGLLNRNIETILSHSETDFKRKIDCQEESLISEYYLYRSRMGKNTQYFDEILTDLFLKSKKQFHLFKDFEKCYLFKTIILNGHTPIKVYVLILPYLLDPWLPYTEVKIIYSNHPDIVTDTHYYNLPKLLSNCEFVSYVKTPHNMARQLFEGLPPIHITAEETNQFTNSPKFGAPGPAQRPIPNLSENVARTMRQSYPSLVRTMNSAMTQEVYENMLGEGGVGLKSRRKRRQIRRIRKKSKNIQTL
jgi:hypothetical protein